MSYEYRIESFWNGRPMSIFEMRNPMLLNTITKQLCDFNFDHKVREEISKFNPIDTDNLQFHTVLKEWGSQVLEKAPAMISELAGQEERIKVIEDLKAAFLFEGYEQEFTTEFKNYTNNEDLPIAFCHNDCLELNILINNDDKKEVMLIDYEYGGWNPMMMDVANYVNETMIDNAHPGGTGIKTYVDNIMSKDEVISMSRLYLTQYYTKHMSEQKKTDKYPTL